MAKDGTPDPVERAAEVRKRVAATIEQVRNQQLGDDATSAADAPAPVAAEETAASTADGGEEETTEEGKGGLGRDVNALLERTRSVIAQTRRVIEETRSSLTRGGKPGDAKTADEAAEE